MMNADNAKRFLGVGLGLLLLFHGVDKLFNGIDDIMGMIGELGLPYSKYTQYLAYGVYLGEVVAPIMLIVGRYVRIAGILIVLNMLVAIGLMHSANIFALGEYGEWAIELPILYLIMASTLIIWKK
jgi:putative oxidoreductase